MKLLTKLTCMGLLGLSLVGCTNKNEVLLEGQIGDMKIKYIHHERDFSDRDFKTLEIYDLHGNVRARFKDPELNEGFILFDDGRFSEFTMNGVKVLTETNKQYTLENPLLNP